MTPITKKVENTRLKTELTLHLITDTMMINLEQKKVQGQIQSFKTPNVIDAIGENGQLQPANISVFEYVFENSAGLSTQIQTYVEANIESIVSK